MTTKFEHWFELTEKFGIRDEFVLHYFMQNQKEILQDAKTCKIRTEHKYMITFTIDPKKHTNLNELNFQDKVEKYIVKILTPLSDRLYYSKEHKDSNVHWHVCVHRKKAFPYEKLAHYKKTYGHVDVSRSRVIENDENTIKYLGKESQIVTIKGETVKL